MIVADTGAMLGLLDRSDKHHETLITLFDEAPDDWVLPWAILPEVDYLVGAHLGAKLRRRGSTIWPKAYFISTGAPSATSAALARLHDNIGRSELD